MVYRGPSLGCKRCIKQHKACDKIKPACSRCQTAGVQCPGYRHPGGVVFENVTEKVVSRETRRAQQSNSSRSHEVANTAVSVLNAPRIDPLTVSVHFFVDKYLSTQGWRPLLSRGHFDYLPALHRDATPASALALSAGLMSARAMFLYHGLAQNDPVLTAQEVAATRALRAAVKIDRECSSDQTLLAVLCMDFAEHVKSKGTGSAASQAHIDGAVALVRVRKTDSFQTDVSRSLLAATMSNVLHRVLWFDSHQAQEAIMHLPTFHLRGMNPSIELHHQLFEILKLERFIGTSFEDLPPVQQNWLAASSSGVYEKLLRWPQRVPEQWKHFVQVEAQEPRSPPEPIDGEAVSCMQLAYLFAMWYCTLLQAIRLFRYTNALFVDENQDRKVLAEAHSILFSLKSMLGYFVDDFQTTYSVSGDYGELLERNTSAVIIDSTGRSTVYIGGARKGYNYLLNILTWVVSLISDTTGLAHGFVFDADIVAFFQARLDTVLESTKL